ncbi:MAG: cation transporter [Actinobacteria bacterium]|nr:cation transporter [Actinomycetota bacterium]
MSKERRLGLVLAVNLVMIGGLVVVGLLSHSLGVFSAAADYVGDAAGVALSLVALRISRHPRGYPRATSYAALVNASLLLLVSLVVAAEGISRLVGGSPTVHGLPVLIASVVAAAAMILCARILGPIESEDVNMRSVMLDTVADAAAALGVAVAGAIILLAHGLYWLDAAVALVIAIVVGYHALRLIREVLAGLRRDSHPAT